MARAAGIDTTGMTAGEIKACAEWAAKHGRAPILPPADHP
jgi:hypothetical protein